MTAETKNGHRVVAGNKVSKRPGSSRQEDFPIVGIGASAGGLEALEQFFANVPSHSGMAFVVIQHLDPHRTGIMPELLQRITDMRVLQAVDRNRVKQNHVYVIPPNKSMSILRGALHLFDPVESHGLRLPIDIFFRSMAEDMQEKSIGIILSGMGSDGSQGLKAIKEKQGLALIQDPETAKFNGMPQSGIETVTPDIISPADKLPLKLIELLKYPVVIKEQEVEELKDYSNIDKITILLRERTGHDFSMYKKKTLFRRIERRKTVHQIDRTADYIRFMQENPQETELLFKELLIGVTSFFRDPLMWNMLRTKILPELLMELPENRKLRAWIPACSTGEEAFSMAIVFKEALEQIKKNKNISLQIFASDLDQEAINKARKGFFPKNIAGEVSHTQLEKYFKADGDGFRVAANIREMVVFAPHDVIKDPPFTRLDILSCRNMLVYMESELQRKLITMFNYCLNPGGLLILGAAESITNHNDIFKEIDPKLKIFKRFSTAVSYEFIDLPNFLHEHKAMASDKKPLPKIIDNFQEITEHIVLQRYAPASVLVNDKGDIIYITGHTGKYLEPVAGKANWNIYVMAREKLRHELPEVFRKVMKNFEPVVLPDIKINTGGAFQYVNVTIQRLESPEPVKGLIIIIFADVPVPSGAIQADHKPGKTRSGKKQSEVEEELQKRNQEIRGLQEEMQTSQEELKSINEELQSTNEELQSTNEELTTSKEEMQSLNEELQTVNIELQSKVNDFLRTNDDMKNLLNSTEIATLFLDKDLNIRRFTDSITKIYKLRNVDIGRPFTDLVNELDYPELESHARQVMKSLVFMETAVTTHDGKWYNIRIMPYRTIDDRIDGLVITFIDITFSKKLEFELKEANDALKKLN